MVSAYALLAINVFEPRSCPESSTACDALLALALLPHVPHEGAADGAGAGEAPEEGAPGDPVAWPALAAWTQLAEFLMDVQVGE